MDEPQRSRFTLALGAAVVVLALVIAALVIPKPEPSPPPAPPAVVATAEPAPAPEPPPPPALRRGDIVAAAARAAAAYAAGEPYGDDNRALVGRRFEVVIPFACRAPGAASPIDPARTTIDPERKTFTLTAQPQVWTDAPWVPEVVGPVEVETIEGFWIPRPWLASETCPPVRAGQPAPATAGAQPERTPTPAPAAPMPSPTEPSVGLARLFDAEASRVGRRGARPYEVVRRIPDAPRDPAARAFQLVLTGRISGFPGGDAIRCTSPSMDRRPACLVGVEFDRVAFADAADGQTLAEWRD